MIEKIYKPETWVRVDRKIYELWANREITTGAFILYCYVSIKANMYGECLTSINEISTTLFCNDKYKPNTINKFLGELKDHRFIWYGDRAGRRGGFKIVRMNFFIPGGKMIVADRNLSGDRPYSVVPISEGESQVPVENHKFIGDKDLTIQGKNHSDKTSLITGGNNDNDKDKGIYINDSVNNKKKSYKCINCSEDFVPEGYEEIEIVNMARELGDGCLDFYLKLNREGKFWVLQRAFNDYKEMSPKGDIKNPPAWFNKRVSNILGENNV